MNAWIMRELGNSKTFYNMKTKSLLLLLIIFSVKTFSQNKKAVPLDTLKPLCYDMKSGYKLLAFENKEFKILNVVYVDSTLQI